MANYIYSARTKEGGLISGLLEASNPATAAKALRSKGLLIIELKTERKILPQITFSGKVSLKDKIIFTQQLAMMIKSGLSLVDALEALEDQTTNKNLKKTIHQINQDIKGGTALSVALAKYPKIFPNLYVAIVRSGERSGKLDEVLFRIADQQKKDYELIARVRGAMLYPAFIFVALLGVLAIILIFVMPQLQSLFKEADVPLPLLTRILLGTSNFIRNFYWLVGLLILTAIIIINRATKISSGKKAWDTVLLKTPLVGNLYRKILMARFNRTMGTLIASGLPMLEVIETTAGVMGNSLYQEAMGQISKDVENGLLLSLGLKKHPVFPAMVPNLVAVGEKSGRLDYIFFQLADFFDGEVDNMTRNLSTLIEPILMVIMGVAVGLVVASVVLPIYGLVEVL